MRRAPFIALAALLVVLIGGAVGVYAYDSSREDLIAEGITVGGVDVGGMRADEARRVLQEQLAEPLDQPVHVKAAGERFTLSAKRAKVETDVGGMVADAVAKSREGNLLSRTARGLTGGSVTADQPSLVTYSDRAVETLVRRVKASVDRPAEDASVIPSGAGLDTVPSQVGREVQAGYLERSVASQLDVPGGERVVEARTETVKPDVTTDEVAEKYPTYITVDRAAKELRFYRNLKLEDTYPIAVGQVGFDTPSGLYHIQSKAVDPAWNVPEWGGSLAGQTIPGGARNNPLKARWLGIYDGAGIHGTTEVDSLGTAASHGCIRMSIPEVKELYDKVPVETPIFIS